MRDAVTDWQELSALYEKADLLTGADLQDWLLTLRQQPHPLLEPLLQMLSARSQVRGNGFLAALPALPAEPRPLAADWHPGARIGPYRLERRLGVGGMAEVWMAERDDGAFARTVAIKLLFRHAGGPQQQGSFAQRFTRERDILASLHHPNIAALHDAGVTPAGQPWLALEYVEGEPLTAWCDRARLDVRARVELFLQVLFAVQHAHANLVIHRDLKPANILVTTTGEVRLLDFGIAKLMEADGDAIADTELTRHAGRLMTVRYASPEQLTGKPLTTACDVYSLGVVLYELLCGELPYEMKVDSAAQLEQAILEVEPRSPSRRALGPAVAAARDSTAAALRKLLGSDLDAIALRALAKQPAQRYASVEALRAELARWLLGEPVEARAPTSAYRLRKFVGRHVVSVALGSGAVVALFAVAATAVALGLQARQESARATAARDFMMGMFKQADSDKSHGADMTARQLLDRGREDVLKRLSGQPELQADLLEGIAGIQVSMGENTKADLTLDELAMLYRRIGESLNAARSMAKRADNALRMGDMRLAKALVDRAIAGLGRSSRDDAELSVSLDLTKGWIAIWEGNPTDAKKLFQEGLARAEKAFGLNTPRVMDALVGVVQAEANLLDFDAALATQTELSSRQLQVPGKTPRDVVELDVSLTHLLYVAGKFHEVVLRIPSSLRRCVVELGADHPNCRTLVYTGAAANLRLGSPYSVTADLKVLQSMADDSSSPDSQVLSLITLFRAHSQIGDLNNYPQLGARVRSLADLRDPPSIAPARRVLLLQELGADALRSGRAAEAEHWLRQADGLVSAGGNASADAISAATTTILLGVARLALGRPDEALNIMRPAQARLSAALGPSHPVTLLYLLYQANALFMLQRTSESLTIVEQVEPVLRQALGQDAPMYQRIIQFRSRMLSLTSPASTASTSHLIERVPVSRSDSGQLLFFN